MGFFGFSNKIINLLKALYSKPNSAVRINGDLTEWFTTSVGVRQGCVISPQLFNILLELVMLYATHDVNVGAKIQGQLISNLRFADDIYRPSPDYRNSQLPPIVDKVFLYSLKFGTQDQHC